MLPSPGAIGELWTCLQTARRLAGVGARDAALGVLDRIISCIDRQINRQMICPKKGADLPFGVYVEALCERGLLYKQMQRYAEAAADFTQAIEIGRSDPHARPPACILRAYLERGILHLFNLNTAQAIADFTFVIDHRPQLFEAYCERAHAFRELGDDASADADLQTAMKLDPTRFLDHYPLDLPPLKAHVTLPDIRLACTIGDELQAALAE